jgi:hypothetical protein
MRRSLGIVRLRTKKAMEVFFYNFLTYSAGTPLHGVTLMYSEMSVTSTADWPAFSDYAENYIFGGLLYEVFIIKYYTA